MHVACTLASTQRPGHPFTECLLHAQHWARSASPLRSPVSTPPPPCWGGHRGLEGSVSGSRQQSQGRWSPNASPCLTAEPGSPSPCVRSENGHDAKKRGVTVWAQQCIGPVVPATFWGALLRCRGRKDRKCVPGALAAGPECEPGCVSRGRLCFFRWAQPRGPCRLSTGFIAVTRWLCRWQQLTIEEHSRTQHF